MFLLRGKKVSYNKAFVLSASTEPLINRLVFIEQIYVFARFYFVIEVSL